MQFQFEAGDVVTLRDVTDWDADDFGLSEENFEQLVDSQHNADEFVVEATEAGDGYDVIIGNADDRSVRYTLRPSHLIPTPETLNNLLGEYGLDL